MPRFNLETDNATFSVRYRIVCEDDGYRGDWHDNEDACYDDARNHRNKPGCENHIMRVVTEQTLSRRINLG